MNALLLIVGIFPYIQSLQLSCNSSLICSNISSVSLDASVCPCPSQSGQYCNNETLVCAEELGLWCDELTKTCTGLANLTYTDVTEDSVVLHWTLNLSWEKLLYTQNYSQEDSEWMSIQIPSTVSSWTITDLESNLTYFAKLQSQSMVSETIVWITRVSKGDCEHVICGPGAACELRDEIPSCQCKDGTKGNPNDFIEGCKEDLQECKFRNQTLKVGGFITDGCTAICYCKEESQIVCEPRCSVETVLPDDPYCRIIQDPRDLCCNVTQCQSFSDHKISGCIYKNTTFHLNEQFSDGCLKNCTCYGQGIISCIPRCPSNNNTMNCSDIEEISDPCCNVSKCIDPKANETINNEYNQKLNPHELLANNKAVNSTEAATSAEQHLENVDHHHVLSPPETIEPNSKEYLHEFNNDRKINAESETPPTTDLKREIFKQINSTEVRDENERENEEKEIELIEHKNEIRNSTEEKAIDIIDYSQVRSSTEENAIDLIDHNKTLTSVEMKTFETKHGNETINSIAEKDVEGRDSSETKDWIQEKVIEISGKNVTRNSTEGKEIEVFGDINEIGNFTEPKGNGEIKDTELGNSTEEKMMKIGDRNETSDILEEKVIEKIINETGNSSDQKTTEFVQKDDEEWITKKLTGVTNGTNSTEQEMSVMLGNSTERNMTEPKDGNGMLNSTRDLEADISTDKNRTYSTIDNFLEKIGDTEIRNSTNETLIEESRDNRTEEEREMMTNFDHRQMRNKWNNMSFTSINSNATDLNSQYLNGSDQSESPLQFLLTNCTEEMSALASNTSDLLLSYLCINGTQSNLTRFEQSENATIVDYPKLSNLSFVLNVNGTDDFNQSISTENSSACVFYEHRLNVGEVLVRDCDAECVCEAPGRFFCHPLLCDYQQRAQVSGCLEWDFDADFEASVNNCCSAANCTLKISEAQNKSCDVNGTVFNHNESLPILLVDSCDQECRCIDGEVICYNRCPNISLSLVNNALNCPVSDILLSPLPGDECCNSWHCQDAETNRSSDSLTPTCETADGPRKVGEWWEKSPDCRIHRCECTLLQNGSASIECRNDCPIIEKYLEPRMDCPLPVLVTHNDSCLCPFVMCNKEEDKILEGFTVDVLSSSSVRINVTVPDSFLHRTGVVELLYTDDSTKTNISTWAKEIFSPRNNTFTDGMLSHEIHNLQPSTTYYIRGKLVISNLTSRLSGSVTVETLPLTMPVSSTASLPALKEIYPQVNVTDIQATSALIVWKKFTSEEKQLIDGIRVKYRIKQKSPKDEKSWSVTSIIHRDVLSYNLINLLANTQYEVGLLIETPQESTTEIVNNESPFVFSTSEIQDDFSFNITMAADKIFANSVDLHWTGVPFPMHKYVHLYGVHYKTEKGSDSQVTYKLPRIEQVTIDDLKPATRYEIWVDAFLSNGDIRKSNILEIQTQMGLEIKEIIKERQETVPQEVASKVETESTSVYYEALIAVAVVAGICILGFIALLVLLLRKQTTATAQITTHKSSHDNPIYKPNFDDEITNGKIQA